MKTPVCDFLREYGESGTVRMHMPGHKGKPETGCDACDLTEIEGADELTAQNNLFPLDKLGQNDPSQTPQTPLSDQPVKQ